MLVISSGKNRDNSKALGDFGYDVDDSVQGKPKTKRRPNPRQ